MGRIEINKTPEEMIMNFAKATGVSKAVEGSPEYEKEMSVLEKAVSKVYSPKD